MPIPPSKYKELAERERLKAMLKEWYGERDGAIEITGHDKKIRTLNELNEDFLKNAIPSNIQLRIELASRWQEIVSPQFAALINFSSITDDGTIFLEVRHSAFLQDELLKSSDLLINRINAKFGKDICKSIQFVPTGRNSYSRNKKFGK